MRIVFAVCKKVYISSTAKQQFHLICVAIWDIAHYLVTQP